MATAPTGLGTDHTTCTGDLVEAMRALLDAQDPPRGKNVDLPEVRPNFEALGTGVHAILTDRAQPVTSKDEDLDFWNWVTAVTTYLADLRAWQSGVRQAVQSWTPADLPGQQFKTALLAVALPGTAPGPAPKQLKGRLL